MIELEVRDIRKNFGGHAGAERRHLQSARQRTDRADRPQRGRQDDADQCPGRSPQACRRPGVVQRRSGSTGCRPTRSPGAGIGRTFQVTRPFVRMTVLENMLVPAMALHPAARKRDASQAGHGSAGLPDHRPPGERLCPQPLGWTAKAAGAGPRCSCSTRN